MTNRDRLERPPIEPMSDVAWARVERGLWERLDAPDASAAPPLPVRSRRWLWLAAPALAAAAVAIVLVARGGGPTEPAEPARLVSGAAPSSLTFGDAHVTLDADSAVVMSHDSAASPSAVLERGGAWFAIAPRRGRTPFVVVAGDTVVRVVGTRFRVARSAELATVEVERGLVDVQFRGAEVQVGPGQRWSSERPAEVVDTKTAAADPDAHDPNAAGSNPTGVDPTDPDATGSNATADPTEPTPTRPAPSKPRPHPRAKPEPAPVEPPPATTAPPPAPTGDAAAREQFKQAEALEVRDPDAAIATYLAIAETPTKWASLALYSAGRLAADRKQPRARALLERYLQRFPTGNNADDAREQLAHLGATR